MSVGRNAFKKTKSTGTAQGTARAARGHVTTQNDYVPYSQPPAPPPYAGGGPIPAPLPIYEAKGSFAGLFPNEELSRIAENWGFVPYRYEDFSDWQSHNPQWRAQFGGPLPPPLYTNSGLAQTYLFRKNVLPGMAQTDAPTAATPWRPMYEQWLDRYKLPYYRVPSEVPLDWYRGPLPQPGYGPWPYVPQFPWQSWVQEG